MSKPHLKMGHPETTTASEDTSSATKPAIALRLQGISKRYPGNPQPAVQDLSLDVGDGEIVALLSPSGCGKTTTLRMAGALEVPDDGEINFGDSAAVI
jgi:osmoprotectant transport system ATP-binding protein